MGKLLQNAGLSIASIAVQVLIHIMHDCIPRDHVVDLDCHAWGLFLVCVNFYIQGGPFSTKTPPYLPIYRLSTHGCNIKNNQTDELYTMDIACVLTKSGSPCCPIFLAGIQISHKSSDESKAPLLPVCGLHCLRMKADDCCLQMNTDCTQPKHFCKQNVITRGNVIKHLSRDYHSADQRSSSWR